MSTPWITDDYLLTTPIARTLYHEHAASAEIVDYHCHLDARELANNRRFDNLAQLWVTSDPYKHRAMRITGVPEQWITGKATSDREKFDAWAKTLPKLLGNPLHPWAALELKRYFGIDVPLTSETADRIWNEANAQLASEKSTARGLLTQRRVACVCTSDRLLDDLSHHAALAKTSFPTRVLPSIRADDLIAVEATAFVDTVKQVGETTQRAIQSYDEFLAAVDVKLEEFDRLGCRLADHGLDEFTYCRVSAGEAAGLFARRLAGEALNPTEIHALHGRMLLDLSTRYAQRGWILQLHLGAYRTTSSRLRKLVGPAGGYAGLGTANDIPSIARFLDDLENSGPGCQVILYPLNPVDFAALATLSGSFTGDGRVAQTQLGPAWWYNDHAYGMRAQLDALSTHGVLSTFIGMTTDSRSLLSMARHEFFRRVLCAWLGEQVAAGLMPNDETALGELVRAVAVGNARTALRLAR